MLIAKPTNDKILECIREHKKESKNDFLILCGETTGLDYESLVDALNTQDIRFCGGIFPGVIYGAESHDDKLLLIPIEFDSDPVLITGLHDGNIQIPSLNSIQASSGSLFILVDGLSNWISQFNYSLYKEIGTEHQVFGSGTGYPNFERIKCLFCKEGFFMDAGIVVSLKNEVTQAIRHGWKTVAGPYLATKTDANLLQQINWEPAYKIYKEIVEKEEAVVITPENYYEYAKHYPFGIHRQSGENLLRDPVSLEEDHSLRFGAEIPSNSVLYLMKSEVNDMLQAGCKVCDTAIEQSRNAEFLFVADCISRTWILNDEFQTELKNIATRAQARNIPVYGVLSMGEISSAGGALLDLHHKTIVISILEGDERQQGI